MKYAKEVMELMSAYPEREFKMQSLVFYIKPNASLKERRTIGRGVRRALDYLRELGKVQKIEKNLAIQNQRYKWLQ